MIALPQELENEIRQRVADGQQESPEALIRIALRAMDELHCAAEARLEQELLEGLEGEDIEVTPDTWRRLEAEAMEVIARKKSA
jgi:Arc/MetJ-type ribon-helix-helix transcriptional regulator